MNPPRPPFSLQPFSRQRRAPHFVKPVQVNHSARGLCSKMQETFLGNVRTGCFAHKCACFFGTCPGALVLLTLSCWVFLYSQQTCSLLSLDTHA